MIKFGYDILFSIRLLHDYYGGPYADMAIVPTTDCETELKNYGLMFKTTPDGGVVLFSRNEKNEINRRLQSLTQFSFLLVLRNAIFDNFTALPYPADKLGKKIYYFSTVNATGALDLTTALAKSSGNKVGDKDYSWLVNTVVFIPLGGNFTQIDLSHTIPGSGKQLIKSFPTTGLQNFIIDVSKIDNLPATPIKLKKGNYILDFLGISPKTEQIYVDESLWKMDCWGILEIIKDNTIDYTAKIEYTLTAKANPWSYYLIDPANKVTITNNALANVSTATTGLAGLSLTWVQEADIEPGSYEQRRYALLKQQNADKRIFLLRSNRSMPKSAESTVSVRLTLDGVQRTLPNPIGSQSKSDSVQTL